MGRSCSRLYRPSLARGPRGTMRVVHGPPVTGSFPRLPAPRPGLNSSTVTSSLFLLAAWATNSWVTAGEKNLPPSQGSDQGFPLGRRQTQSLPTPGPAAACAVTPLPFLRI